ncbi:MAG: hypothetical protein OEZ32_11270 [Nitrospinota bacterium]|nr:hypothetical protein [Nitrospinota bacterium]
MFSTLDLHQEKVLQEHLIGQLVAQQGYIERQPEQYDRAFALDRELTLKFVQHTQPDEWAKLETQYKTSAEDEFFKRLQGSLKSCSTLEVLRNGITLIPRIKSFRSVSSSPPPA